MHNRAEQRRTEQSRAEQSRAEQSRAEQSSTLKPNPHNLIGFVAYIKVVELTTDTLKIMVMKCNGRSGKN